MRWIKYLFMCLLFVSCNLSHVSCTSKKNSSLADSESMIMPTVPYPVGAAWNGDIKRLKKLIEEEGMDVNKSINVSGLIPFTSSRMSTMLTLASHSGQTKAVEYLLSQGANTLMEALQYAGNVEIAKLLIERGAEVNPDGDIIPPLFYAVWSKNMEVVEFFINQGAELNQKAEHGHLPLHDAIRTDQIDLASLIFKKGGNPLLKDEQNMTALAHAKMLLKEKKSDPALEKLIKDFEAYESP